MHAILGQIIKTVAGALLSSDAKSSSSGKKSSDKKSNDLVSEIISQFSGVVESKSQGGGSRGQCGGGKGQGGGGKGSGCQSKINEV